MFGTSSKTMECGFSSASSYRGSVGFGRRKAKLGSSTISLRARLELSRREGSDRDILRVRGGGEKQRLHFTHL